MITEVLTKNNRYQINKSELSLEGNASVPETLPTNDARGIIMYIKHELQTVEILETPVQRMYMC